MSKESAIEVVGGEIIGEKAEMLRDHEDLINEVGLQIPPTTIIASEALEPFRLELEEDREITAEQLGELAAHAAAPHTGSPVLAVRSSAEGDARGTGIYNSVFSNHNTSHIQDSIVGLLKNFNRRGALDFRQQAEFGENFAILSTGIGQVLDELEHIDMFGPPISGFGYSQTRFESEGIINIVAGLGGGVDRRGGEKIQPVDIERSAKLIDPHTTEGKEDLSLIDFLTTPLTAEDAFRLTPSTDFRDKRRCLKLTVNSLAIGILSYGTISPPQYFLQELPNYIE